MTDTTPTSASSDEGNDLRERSEALASAASDQAASVADTAQSQLSEVRSEVADQAKAVVEDARYQASRLMEDSRRELSAQAQQQATRLAGGVRDVSHQLEAMLRGGEAPQGPVADLAAQAADTASRLANQLEQRRPEELLDELRSLARRRPAMFLLGAMGAGLLVGRLVRSADGQGLVEAAKTGAADAGAADTASAAMPAAASGELEGTASTPVAAFGSSVPAEVRSAVRP